MTNNPTHLSLIVCIRVRRGRCAHTPTFMHIHGGSGYPLLYTYIVYDYMYIYTPILNFKLAPHHFYTLMYSVYYEYPQRRYPIH